MTTEKGHKIYFKRKIYIFNNKVEVIFYIKQNLSQHAYFKNKWKTFFHKTVLMFIDIFLLSKKYESTKSEL